MKPTRAENRDNKGEKEGAKRKKKPNRKGEKALKN
jgi:hypothetical protein